MKNPLVSAITYFRSAKAELEKVTWPSRDEVARYSALVIASCVILAAFFAALDLGLNTGVTSVLNRRQQPQAPVTAPPTPSEIEKNLQPTNAANGIEAVDQNGNPVDVKITPVTE